MFKVKLFSMAVLVLVGLGHVAAEAQASSFLISTLLQVALLSSDLKLKPLVLKLWILSSLLSWTGDCKGRILQGKLEIWVKVNTSNKTLVR